jgi:hypothetical protein
MATTTKQVPGELRNKLAMVAPAKVEQLFPTTDPRSVAKGGMMH